MRSSIFTESGSTSYPEANPLRVSLGGRCWKWKLATPRARVGLVSPHNGPFNHQHLIMPATCVEAIMLQQPEDLYEWKVAALQHSQTQQAREWTRLIAGGLAQLLKRKPRKQLTTTRDSRCTHPLSREKFERFGCATPQRSKSKNCPG